MARRKSKAVIVRDTPLGRLLRSRREELDLSVREVAVAADITHTYVGNLEKGKNELPSRQVLAGLARVLDIPELELAAAAYQIQLPAKSPQELLGNDVDLEEVTRALESIDRLATDEAKLAAFQKLPPVIRRVVRQIASALVASTREESEASS